VTPCARAGRSGAGFFLNPFHERNSIMTIERIHPQNDERAAWAAKALAAFQKETGADLPELVGDLLVDLMHWCDRNNYDFDAVLFRARDHYAAEVEGEEFG
jgi:hypothetical protein